jgi:hypothetical protein
VRILLLVLTLGGFAATAYGQRISLVDDVARSWIREGRASAAAAFLDAVILISDQQTAQERIRLFLLSAVAHAESRRFGDAYQRVRQAEDLLEWSGFRDHLTYDDKARARIRSSIDLVLHDLRRAEGKIYEGAPKL